MADTAIREQISRQHPDYETINTNGEKYLAAYLAGTELLTQTYIHRHVFEDKKQYESRVQRAFTIPFMQNLITRTVNALFKKGVMRSGESLMTISDFFKDCTGANVAYDQFIRSATAASILFGNIHVLVDYSISESEEEIVKNMSQPLDVAMGAKELMPNLRLFTPMGMTNWNYVPRYGYEACVFKIQKLVDNQLKNWFLYVDYEEIVEFDESGSEQTTYEHGLGYTPVFTLVNQGVNGNSESFGSALSSAQIAVTNLCSIVDEISERHAFSQLTCPDDGTYGELAAKESDYLRQWARLESPTGEIEDGSASPGLDRVLRRVANSSVFTFPADTGQPPKFISPEASQLNTIWEIAKGIMETASMNLGMFDKAGNILPEETIPYFRAMATELVSFEKRLLSTAMLYLGQNNQEYSILYPYYAPAPNMDWMDTCDRIASAMWLDDNAKQLMIQNIIKDQQLGLTESDTNTIVNGVSITSIEEQTAYKNGRTSQWGNNSGTSDTSSTS